MSKFKIGDKVKILDGSNIAGYCCGWTSGMERFVGTTATISRVDIFSDSSIGYRMNELPYTFDERGIRSAVQNTIVIYRKGNKVIAIDKSTGKKTEACCNPTDEFDFHVGAKLAFQRLIGETPQNDDAVRGVKRPAKVGEYIKIVNPINVPIDGETGEPSYKTGSILKAFECNCDGCVRFKEGYDIHHISYSVYPGEYVVLENYKPEKDDEIHVGDMVKVVNCGMIYDSYEMWSGLNGYEQNFVKGSSNLVEEKYKVLNIKKHNIFKKHSHLFRIPIQHRYLLLKLKDSKK